MSRANRVGQDVGKGSAAMTEVHAMVSANPGRTAVVVTVHRDALTSDPPVKVIALRSHSVPRKNSSVPNAMIARGTNVRVNNARRENARRRARQSVSLRPRNAPRDRKKIVEDPAASRTMRP